MSEIKHTPGPLTVRIRRPVFKGLCIEAPDGKVCTAEVYGTENSNEIDDAAWANAYLYAAAPELLEALEQCQRTLAILIDPANKGSGIDNMAAWASCVATENLARSAIAKAKGEA